jgi:hypothetical protein
MVNTGYHNSKATTKMTKQQFLAIFSDTTINQSFLGDLFESIKKNPMVLPIEASTNTSSSNSNNTDDDISTEELLMAINSTHTDVTPDNTDQLFYFDFHKNIVAGNQQLIRILIRDCHPRIKYQDHTLRSDKNLPKEIQRGKLFILLYNTLDQKSFVIATKLIDRIQKRTTDSQQPQQQQQEDDDGSENIPIFLVGLLASSETERRQVTHRQGVDIALEKGISFYEIAYDQIDQIIAEACSEMVKIDNEAVAKSVMPERPRTQSDAKKISLDDLLSKPKLYI